MTGAERVKRYRERHRVFAGLGKFGVILADPPWDYRDKGHTRRIDRQYPVMKLAEICALPVAELAERDCVLFLWVPTPHLPDGLTVMKAWGFTYKSFDPWDKGKMGGGHYWRIQHEPLLLGTKGKPGIPATHNRPRSVMREWYRGHSVKPDVAYRNIERMYPRLSKIDLFARRRRLGWEAWGNDPVLAAPTLPLEAPVHDHVQATERSRSGKTRLTEAIALQNEAIALLEQELERSPATKE